MKAAAVLVAVLCVNARAAPFKWRGVLEGYFGKPWTWEQRERLVDWLPKHHFNLYAIGPKEDPELRARWREPLKEETKTRLRSLAARAKRRGVTLAWTLSPGADARPGDEGDVAAAADKLSSVCALGVERLTLAFDDAPAVRGQAAFANEVLRRVRARCPGAWLTFAPAQYWGAAAPSPYLDELARQLDPSISVAWTGQSVLNRAITAEQARRFKDYIKHDLVLCDNYPVQDRLVDSGRLFLGPLTGRDPSLSGLNEAYLANATPLLESSLIPLATAGDWAFDPARYDARASWRRALDSARGGVSRDAFETFAGLCARSWLDDLPGNETDRLERVASRYFLTGDAKVLRAMLAELEALPRALSRLPAPLARELAPWIAAAGEQARHAAAIVDRQERIDVRTRAIVADQVLDRLMSRAAFNDPAGGEPLARAIRRYRASGEGRASVRVGLERFSSLAPGDEELEPWTWVLGRYAESARDGLDGRPWSAARLWALRWRARARLLPLLVSRRLLETFIVSRELAWGLTAREPRLLGLERFWLAWTRLSSPRSEVGRLKTALEGNARAVTEELSRLERLDAEASARPSALEEAPWLDKIAQYADAARAALQAKPPADWAARRERLASGNGLELVLELKLELEALARGGKGEVTFPADPADAL